jgi:signal transduction histidine kinase
MTYRSAFRRMPRFIWIAAVGTALLLVAAALLQYRWNRQMQHAAEIRSGSDVESRSVQWQLTLYRQLSSVCSALQVGPDSGAHNHWSDYSRRYREWRAVSDSGSTGNVHSTTNVVADVYIFEASRGKSARLLRLDPNLSRMEMSPTPLRLRSLLAHLQGRSANLRTALRTWESDDLRSVEDEAELSAPDNGEENPLAGWQFDESVPAIVHPIVVRNTNRSSGRTPVDWIVVALSQAAIRQQLFPELAHSYFGGLKGLEYKLAVVAVGDTPRLLYSSDPGFEIRDVNDFDAVLRIFGPDVEAQEASFLRIGESRAPPGGRVPRIFTGPAWFPVIRQTSESPSWVLFLRHRTNALEASKTAWSDNLLRGGLLLLLLAISTVLLLIAGQREHTQAARQMDFVASIAHDLHAPLAAMLSAGQNLAGGYAHDVDRYGSIITTQARQLTNLVDEVLLFASMKEGKKKYFLTPVRLTDALRSLRQTALVPLEQNGFEIDFGVAENLPCVLADRQALSHCLENLIENAAKYGGDSRWIGVSAKIEESSRGREIKVSVADHGVGIAPRDLHHIFEPFYRSPRAIASHVQGNGLGLSIVKHTVQGMGGRVTVTSEIGVGSVFTLYLQTTEASDLRSGMQVQEVLHSSEQEYLAS